METLTSNGSIIFCIWEQALQWKLVFRLSSEMWYKHGVDWTLSYSLWSQWNGVHFLWPPVRVRKICFRKWAQLWEESSTWNLPQCPSQSSWQSVRPDSQAAWLQTPGGREPWRESLGPAYPRWLFSLLCSCKRQPCKILVLSLEAGSKLDPMLQTYHHQ